MAAIAIFVPRRPVDPGSPLEHIVAGSGIVGTPNPVEAMAADRMSFAERMLNDEPLALVLIDYEGNLYGAVGLDTYEGRVRRAYERHVSRYPTVARMLVPAAELVQIGWYDPETGAEIDAAYEAEFDRWLDEATS